MKPGSHNESGRTTAYVVRIFGPLLIVIVSISVVQAEPRAPSNPIQRENARPGTPDWRLTKPALRHEIEGYASHTSVDRGTRIGFYIHTQDPSYSIAIYRMGWYGGDGARLVHGPVIRQGVSQPMPSGDPHTGLIECSWNDPYVIAVEGQADQEEWVSGMYLAKLTAGTSGAQAYIIFVIRDETRPSDFLFQSSVTTYQA